MSTVEENVQGHLFHRISNSCRKFTNDLDNWLCFGVQGQNCLWKGQLSAEDCQFQVRKMLKCSHSHSDQKGSQTFSKIVEIGSIYCSGSRWIPIILWSTETDIQLKIIKDQSLFSWRKSLIVPQNCTAGKSAATLKYSLFETLYRKFIWSSSSVICWAIQSQREWMASPSSCKIDFKWRHQSIL